MGSIQADFYVERKDNNKWYVRAVTRFIEDQEEKRSDEFISEPFETKEEAEKYRLQVVDMTKNYKLHAAALKHPKN